MSISQLEVEKLRSETTDGVSSDFVIDMTAQISEIDEKAIPINKMKAIKFGLSVFQYKILLLNIILRVNFTREAEIVILRHQNNCQLLSLFTDFKIRYKNAKIIVFYLTDSLVWYMLM